MIDKTTIVRLRGPLAAAVVFLVGLVGALRSPAIYHGDERFYTDAALAMARNGDYCVPRYSGGEPRLVKPLLSYWVILAEHRLLGVGLWQARSAFAVCAALLIVLAGSIARRLFDDEHAGTLTALILAGNPGILALGSRSTPDILVCLSILLSLDGAARVLLEGRPGKAAPWMFWIGAGLAAAAKGLWGVLVVAFVLVGAKLSRVEPARLRRLVPLAPVIAGSAIAFVGIAPLLLAGAAHVVHDGGADQLRATPTASTALRNLAGYAPAPLIHFLPWSLFLGVLVLSRDAREAARSLLRRGVSRGALAWWLFLVVVFLFGTQRRVRYLAPASPGLALVITGVLVACADLPVAGRRLQRMTVGVSLAVSAVLLVSAALLVAERASVAVLLAAMGGAGCLLTWKALRAEPRAALVAGGWTFLLGTLSFVGVLRPAFTTSPLPAVLTVITEHAGTSTSLTVDGLNESVAARLRQLSAGSIEAVQPDRRPSFVLAGPEQATAWIQQGYASVAQFDPSGGPGGKDILSWLRGERPRLRRASSDERWQLLHDPSED